MFFSSRVDLNLIQMCLTAFPPYSIYFCFILIMAKQGTKGDQKNNPVSLKDMKSITKSLYSMPSQKTATTC